VTETDSDRTGLALAPTLATSETYRSAGGKITTPGSGTVAVPVGTAAAPLAASPCTAQITKTSAVSLAAR
jgi:hypothetical protein